MPDIISIIIRKYIYKIYKNCYINMDIDNIGTDLRFLHQLGMTINTEERLKLQILLQNLKASTDFEFLKFWGKIEGTTPYSRRPKRLLHSHGPKFPRKLRIPPKDFLLQVKIKYQVLPTSKTSSSCPRSTRTTKTKQRTSVTNFRGCPRRS